MNLSFWKAHSPVLTCLFSLTTRNVGSDKPAGQTRGTTCLPRFFGIAKAKNLEPQEEGKEDWRVRRPAGHQGLLPTWPHRYSQGLNPAARAELPPKCPLCISAPADCQDYPEGTFKTTTYTLHVTDKGAGTRESCEVHMSIVTQRSRSEVGLIWIRSPGLLTGWGSTVK